MANQRMYLKCTDPDCPERDNELYLAKRMAVGYYTVFDHKKEDWNKWFDLHAGCAGMPDNFELSWESEPEHYGQDKSSIIQWS